MAHPAVVIDTTVGGANANSYVTLAEVDDYLATHRLFVSGWSTGVDADRIAAIIWAMLLIEARIKWKGIKSTSIQSLSWPRYGAIDDDGYLIGYDYTSEVYIIPEYLKHAVSELAYLLKLSDRTAEVSSKGLNSLKLDVISLDFNEYNVSETIPDSVMGYLIDLGTIKGPSSGIASLVRT